MGSEITCSVCIICQKPGVELCGRQALGPGAVHVTRLSEIRLADITP